MNRRSLASSAALPEKIAAFTIEGSVRPTAQSTGNRPRARIKKGTVLPPRVIVPSKSKAATVGRTEPP